MSKLNTIAETFQALEPQMRLDLLLEYADTLPPLAEAYQPLRDAGLHVIRECRSPVFMLVTLSEGSVVLHADVPREAVVARGFANIMVTAFNGVEAGDVLQAPSDIVDMLGLGGVVGMQRRRGLSGIYRHIRREVERLSDLP